ncbi:MAG TPA: hypothetical protein IAB43_10745 [Candidatus Spyradocola merdavium]|nr:hypothetical protein [Candidatus Spyradocola merdavium]
MDRENDYYGPRGFHALMEHHPAASDYFHSLPKDVQDQLLRRAHSIETEDSLHAQARHYLRSR